MAQALLRCMAFAAACILASAASGEKAAAEPSPSTRAAVQSFRDLGLTPAGDRGYLQALRYREQTVLIDRSDIRLSVGEAAHAVALGRDLVLDLTVQQPRTVEAGLVFVGYGLPAALGGRDDFAGHDLRGRIAVYVDATPMFMTADQARNARALAKAAAERAGAIGLIAIDPSEQRWSVESQGWTDNGRYPADSALQSTRAPQLAGRLAPSLAQELFALDGRDLATILAAARAGRPLPRFALSAVLIAAIETRTKTGSVDTVVAKLSGRDAFLARNSVVVSAQADDIQALLRLAKDATAAGASDRTLVFALLPDGLRTDQAARILTDRLGAPQDKVVAAIHLNAGADGPAAVSAATESTLGETARDMAAARGISLAESPGNSAVTGFALAGTPALGLEAVGAEDLAIALTREIANGRGRPSWRPDSLFAPPAPRAQENLIAPLEMPVGKRPQRILPTYGALASPRRMTAG